MGRQRTLVCTADCPGGWHHGVTDIHRDKTITLSVFRITEGGGIVYHPASGKTWKYRSFEDRDLIFKTTDKIGLIIKSLKESSIM